MPTRTSSSSAVQQSDNSSKSAVGPLDKMAFLKAYLPRSVRGIFHVQRYGNYYGIPTKCPFCDDPPPDWAHTTAERRRWQITHVAGHVKGY